MIYFREEMVKVVYTYGRRVMVDQTMIIVDVTVTLVVYIPWQLDRQVKLVDLLGTVKNVLRY